MRARAGIIVAALALHSLSGVARAQVDDPDTAGDAPTVADEVQVRPEADDAEIARRLERIYAATPDWLRDVVVEVNEGVVVLRGVAESEDHGEWATSVARNTQAVVAVVNLLEVPDPPLFDVADLGRQASAAVRSIARSLPTIGVSLVVLLVTIGATVLTARVTRRHLDGRTQNPLIAQVLANAVAAPVLVLGLYLVLILANLTNLALTLLGGAGLFGLVMGIAFRDIAENYLASIFISVRRPFRIGDTIEAAEVVGVVQTVTTRGTLLVTFDGNHVLIPNAIVYKSVVTNRTANPKIRESFLVGIGVNESVAEAQRIAMAVLEGHEAVLADPPPMVLVEELGASTVNLRIYLWLDGTRHAPVKVRSAAIRLVRRALMNAGVSMPADAREVTFPAGVSVQLLREGERPAPAPAATPPAATETAAACTDAEGGLETEEADIREQARDAEFPDQGRNLIDRQD